MGPETPGQVTLHQKRKDRCRTLKAKKGGVSNLFQFLILERELLSVAVEKYKLE